jgi:hypothetical protein
MAATSNAHNYPQEWLVKHSDYPYNSHGTSVVRTFDGCYLLGGYSWGNCTAPRDAHLWKVDPNGNPLWYADYGDPLYEERLESIFEKNNHRILGGGFTDNPALSFGGKDMYLIHTRPNGALLWENHYGRDLDDECFAVIETSDGGYLLGGYTTVEDSVGVFSTDFYLVKTLATGSIVWEQVWGDPHVDDVIFSVVENPGGGYAVAGVTYRSGDADMYLANTDLLGNVLWEQLIGSSPGDQICRSVQTTSDGGYVLGGIFCAPASLPDMLMVKTDASGSVDFEYTYGGAGMDKCFDVKQTPDDGFLLGGKTDSFGPDIEMYLVETAEDGGQTGEEIYNDSPQMLVCRSLALAPGNRCILGGSSITIPEVDELMALVLVRHQHLTISVTPVGSPVIIPPTGGSFQYEVEITSVIAEPFFLEAWVEIVLPGGGPDITVVGPVSTTISPYASISATLTQFIPAAAPAGIYTVNGFTGGDVGPAPLVDSFTFEKLSFPDSGSGGMGEIQEGWFSMGGFSDLDEIELNESQPQNYKLIDVYPNPFNPTTSISFSMPQAMKISLTVYDVSGRLVAEVVNGWRDAGSHEVTFDGSGLSSGVYIYRFSAGSDQTSGKMMLIK